MPNGASKNLVRLSICAAAYRRRFGEWPAEFRADPNVIWDLAQILDADHFTLLATRLRIRTSAETTRFSVGGSLGVVWYDEVDHGTLAEGATDAARAWLGVEMRVAEY
jgi:hypothetical protein